MPENENIANCMGTGHWLIDIDIEGLYIWPKAAFSQVIRFESRVVREFSGSDLNFQAFKYLNNFS